MNSIQSLLTDHLDIWTTANTEKKSGRGRSSGNADRVYGIKKLRELILELAVRGKLVLQDANDESASELLKRIQTEKTKLIAEGKIKKDKPLAPITENEMPFELPQGWEWTRVAQVGHDWGQKSPDSDFTYIEVSAIDSQRGIVSSPELVKPENAPSRARKVVKKGSVIYSTIRPYLLNVAVIEDDFSPEPIASTAFAIVHPFCLMPPRYFLCFFRSPVFVRYVESVQMGIAYPAINDGQFFSSLIPLPPIEEQHRIVAKVDELMALCDQLEQQQTHSLEAHQTLVEILLDTLTRIGSQQEFSEAWSRIASHFDTLFTTEASIDQLKQTILQLAVMGKLVTQDSNDEPASVFLEKIAQEKAMLIKAGEIRKQKELPEIKGYEIGFNLSAGWAVSRLGTFTNVGTGATPSRDKTAYWSPQEVNWVASGETSNDFITETSEKISSLAVKETNVTVYPVGTLIVAMYGQGKTRGQVSELMIEAGTNQACAAVVLINKDEAHRKYLKLFFKKAYEEMRSHSAGGAQPNLNVGKISNTVVPIPPLAEQHRIVDKVDELMAICDALKARLADAQAIQIHFADAIVEQAVC